MPGKVFIREPGSKGSLDSAVGLPARTNGSAQDDRISGVRWRQLLFWTEYWPL